MLSSAMKGGRLMKRLIASLALIFLYAAAAFAQAPGTAGGQYTADGLTHSVRGGGERAHRRRVVDAGQ